MGTFASTFYWNIIHAISWHWPCSLKVFGIGIQQHLETHSLPIPALKYSILSILHGLCHSINNSCHYGMDGYKISTKTFDALEMLCVPSLAQIYNTCQCQARSKKGYFLRPLCGSQGVLLQFKWETGNLTVHQLTDLYISAI